MRLHALHDRQHVTHCCYCICVSRGAQIRTGDPLLPKQVRYRTAPRPECSVKMGCRAGESQLIATSLQPPRYAQLEVRRQLPSRHRNSPGTDRANVRHLVRQSTQNLQKRQVPTIQFLLHALTHGRHTVLPPLRLRQESFVVWYRRGSWREASNTTVQFPD